MPKRTSKDERVRLNLAIPVGVSDRLERLRILSEAESVTEVIRRSLAVYDLLLSHYHDNGEVILRSQDGSEECLRILT
jgi:hypothetical protein